MVAPHLLFEVVSSTFFVSRVAGIKLISTPRQSRGGLVKGNQALRTETKCSW